MNTVENTSVEVAEKDVEISGETQEDESEQPDSIEQEPDPDSMEQGSTATRPNCYSLRTKVTAPQRLMMTVQWAISFNKHTPPIEEQLMI